MCGYARRHHTDGTPQAFLEKVDLGAAFRKIMNQPGLIEQFYPAFGGAVDRKITNMIIQEEGELKLVDATWWFECHETENRLAVDNGRTTFNARNLASPYWRTAIRYRRGIALVTAIGEGKTIEGKNKRYFVESDTPMLLGTVYRAFPGGHYSTAVITRDSHPRFEPYHDKAFPLFLPPNADFIKLWLGPEPETHPAIAGLLEHPRIFNRLKVTQVKTFKDALPLAPPEYLDADEAA